jgi:hypothetical protein
MALVNTTGSATVDQDTLSILSGLTSPACTIKYWLRCTSFPHPALSARSVQTVHSVGSAGVLETDAVGIEGPGDTTGDHFLGAGSPDAGPENDMGPSADFTGWQFIAWSIDGSGDWTCYTGVEGSTPTVLNTGSLTTGGGIITDHWLGRPASYGARSAAASKYAYITIWNGVAMNATQIAAEAKSPTPVITSGLFSYLSCASGTTIGHTTQGSGGDWTNSGSGMTLDSDMPALGPVPNAIFFGAGTTG